jgi:hypothetical protein
MTGLRNRFVAGKVERNSFTYTGTEIEQDSCKGVQVKMNDYIQNLEILEIKYDRIHSSRSILSSKEQSQFRSVVGSLIGLFKIRDRI